MARYKVTRSGVTFAGKVYGEGEYFEVDHTKNAGSKQREHLYERVRSGNVDGVELVADEAPKKAASKQEPPSENKEEGEKKEVASTEQNNEKSSGTKSAKADEKPAEKDEEKKGA